ncbi:MULTISPECIES: helix-turn-helix domain-containing protein [Chitinophaga]|jgi:transcriptional regulator with XRE-family HTH domain|uniref:Helix-turn-helix protein n=1 Tax=Chitinophaga ginsengisoli TaxID=363837 RepID=A0A2P8FXK5_9BACT|nr:MULTISPECIES: helix-turn-helix transcriptional regulator [Chitinophaga]MCF6404442.1 helix-turn-helix domain-containing protein [Chitinophaga filiformis]PSL26441.1 helix-turn-helix protein [Chitinophaga ginsengisoli]
MTNKEDQDYQYILDRIAVRLIKYRKDNNLSLRQLAADTGLDHSWLSKVEQGKKDLRLVSIYKLAERTTGDILYFLGEEE